MRCTLNLPQIDSELIKRKRMNCSNQRVLHGFRQTQAESVLDLQAPTLVCMSLPNRATCPLDYSNLQAIFLLLSWLSWDKNISHCLAQSSSQFAFVLVSTQKNKSMTEDHSLRVWDERQRQDKNYDKYEYTNRHSGNAHCCHVHYSDLFLFGTNQFSVPRNSFRARNKRQNSKYVSGGFIYETPLNWSERWRGVTNLVTWRRLRLWASLSASWAGFCSSCSFSSWFICTDEEKRQNARWNGSTWEWLVPQNTPRGTDCRGRKP